MTDTNQQFEIVMARCRDLFRKKLHDYGAAWRLLRIPSVTDQLLIKAKRIRSLEKARHGLTKASRRSLWAW